MQYPAGPRWHVVLIVLCSAAYPSSKGKGSFLSSYKVSSSLRIFPCWFPVTGSNSSLSQFLEILQAPISWVTFLGYTSRILFKPNLDILPFLCALLKIYYTIHYAFHFLLCLSTTLRSREGLLPQSINKCFLSINGSGTLVVTPPPDIPGIHTNVRYLSLVPILGT